VNFHYREENIFYCWFYFIRRLQV